MVADVAVWGRIPPPIGGMSVHLQRLAPYLKEAGISMQMYSVGRRTPDHELVRQVSEKRLFWLMSLLAGPCEPLHYVFSDQTQARFAASLLSCFGRAKVVLRVGGESLAWAVNSSNPVERLMIRFAIKHADAVIGVSEEITNLAKFMGAKRVLHVPGFIPPPEDNEPLPEVVASFIARHDGRVLLASGEVGPSPDDDLYGAYFLLKYLELVPGARVVFYAYRITTTDSNQEQLNQEIHRRGLQGRYLLFRSSQGIQAAIRQCDIFLRPTLSDGDSNVIREALHFGVPVIASDCVQRPDGVETYPAGNVEALKSLVERVAGNLDAAKKRIGCLPKADNALLIVNLFRELLGRPILPTGRSEQNIRI